MSINVKPPFGCSARVGEAIARDLVGAWIFNEGLGITLRDVSALSLDGQVDSSFAWASGPASFTGSFGGAAEVDCGQRAFLTRFSIVARVRFTGTTGNNHHILASKGDYGATNTNFALFLRPYAPNAYDFGVYANDGTTGHLAYHREASAWGPFDGTWHTLGVTWDGSLFKLHLDGVGLSLTGGTHGTGADGSQNLYIARGSTDSYSRWVGLIDCVYVWGRGLSGEEMRWVARDPYSLVGGWPAVWIVGVGGATIRDVSGTISCVSSASGTAMVSRASERPTGAPWPRVQLEIEASWLREALMNGLTDTGHRLGTVLTQGWFWMRRAGCTAVYRGAEEDPCRADFGSSVCVADADLQKIPLPAYLPHDPNSTCCYVARRFNGSGCQDRTTSAAVVVRIGADGRLAAPVPNPILRLRAQPTGGDKLEIVWFYCPLDQQAAPRAFHVYWDHGTGQLDWVNALATVPYEGRKFYRHRTDSLEAGTYLFAVRAEGAAGAESPPPPGVHGIIDSSTPDAPVIVAAEVI